MTIRFKHSLEDTKYKEDLWSKPAYAAWDGYFDARSKAVYTDSSILFGAIIPHFFKNTRDQKKLAKSILSYFQKSKALLLYDLNLSKSVLYFGTYPDRYCSDPGFIVNHKYYFTTSTQTAVTFLSFQADPNIYIYNLQGQILDTINAPGIFSTGQVGVDSFSMAVFKGRELFNILCDSYNEIISYDDYLFRVYNTGLHFEDYVASQIALLEGEFCFSSETEIYWANLRLSKPAYLQKIKLSDRTIIDIPFPAGMNVFVGYNTNSDIYYFRRISFGKKETGDIIVYGYRLDSIF